MKRVVSKNILLHYPKEHTEKPIISNLIKRYDLTVNISRARIGQDEEGTMVIEISGKQEEAREEESTDYLLRERRWASFERSFTLPEEVLPDKADAKMKNGILTLKVPKKEPVKVEAHKVKIK